MKLIYHIKPNSIIIPLIYETLNELYDDDILLQTHIGFDKAYNGFKIDNLPVTNPIELPPAPIANRYSKLYINTSIFHTKKCNNLSPKYPDVPNICLYDDNNQIHGFDYYMYRSNKSIILSSLIYKYPQLSNISEWTNIEYRYQIGDEVFIPKINTSGKIVALISENRVSVRIQDRAYAYESFNINQLSNNLIRDKKLELLDELI